MKGKSLLMILAALLVLAPLAGQAALYKYVEKDGTRMKAAVVHGTIESVNGDLLWALDPHGWSLCSKPVIDRDKFEKAFKAGEISKEVAAQVIVITKKKPYVLITDDTQETPDGN